MIEDSGAEAIQAWLAIIAKNTADRRQIAFKYKSKKALLSAANSQGYFGITIPNVQLAPRVVLWGTSRQVESFSEPEPLDLLSSLSQALASPQIYDEDPYPTEIEIDDELQHLIDMTLPSLMSYFSEPTVTQKKGLFNLDFTI